MHVNNISISDRNLFYIQPQKLGNIAGISTMDENAGVVLAAHGKPCDVPVKISILDVTKTRGCLVAVGFMLILKHSMFHGEFS